MTTWTGDELDRIGSAVELDLESLRRDGSLRAPVTMWVVRDGDDLYIRSVKGRSGPWFSGTQTRGAGRIHAGGVDRDVTFADAEPDVAPRLDAAYRAKYGTYPPEIVGSVLTALAREATIRLIPR